MSRMGNVEAQVSTRTDDEGALAELQHGVGARCHEGPMAANFEMNDPAIDEVAPMWLYLGVDELLS